MFVLKVDGLNSASKAFIWEVTIQCQIAQHVYGRIAEYARVQVTRQFEATRPRPRSAIELLSDCTTFLSACAVLSRCLFGKGSFAAQRSERLRQLLNLPDLPAIRSLDVRNSFEHIDERLDRLLREDPREPIIQIHLARKSPTARLVLKRFDPESMCLAYLDQQLNLAMCAAEVAQVSKAAIGLAGRDRSQIGLLPVAQPR